MNEDGNKMRQYFEQIRMEAYIVPELVLENMEFFGYIVE